MAEVVSLPNIPASPELATELSWNWARLRLKAFAPSNMFAKVVALATFQFEISLLKAAALLKVDWKDVTRAVSHPEMSWLKAPVNPKVR